MIALVATIILAGCQSKEEKTADDVQQQATEQVDQVKDAATDQATEKVDQAKDAASNLLGK